jgi:hypothetical protein
MVHHAECKRKLLSKSCRIRNASYKNWRSAGATTDFSHNCDTEGGSSGAPVFTPGGALVGLHHLGFALGDDQQCDKVNKAVHIQVILDDIRRAKPMIYNEIEGQVAVSND